MIAECVVSINVQELHLFFSLLVGKEGIFISLVGNIVDANIMDDCKIGLCRTFVTSGLVGISCQKICIYT